MTDLERRGREIYQQVVDLVGKPKVCKTVDAQARAAVTRLLNQTGGGSRQAASVAGRAVGNEVRQLCTAMTPEGRTVIILAGAAATVAYGVLYWDDVEPKIRDAIRNAQIPVTVPIDRVNLPGELTLSLGLEDMESRYRVNMGPGRLDLRLQHDLDLGRTQVTAGWNGSVGAGSANARVHYDSRTDAAQLSGSYQGTAYGGQYNTGVRYNTRSGDGALFFEYKLTW